MSIFDDDSRHMEDEYYEDSRFSMTKAILFTFGAIFIPSVILGVLIFLIFLRTLRWRPRVTFTILSPLFITLLFSMSLLNNLELNGISSLKENWASLLSIYIYWSLVLGLLLGFAIILYKTYELKRYPEYTHLRGWAYGFEYAPTPIDKLRRKRNMKSLKGGQEFDYERAPLGILEEPVRKGNLNDDVDTKQANMAAISYRYYTEAMAHTLITGKTGSGKALHVDTAIRCKEKGWTTIGDIEVGDTLYDEKGNYTKVEAIYQPMTKDHYELTFDNGEIVKACGDHLWNMGDVNRNNTMSTRELRKNYMYIDKTICHNIDGINIKHELLKIKRIKDNPADYLCFTVDSESHLFLITESFIPTHNTVTMLSLIQNDIMAGNPICVIDFKKSPDLIYFLSKWAKENGREFYHFVSGKPGTYRNPYKDDQSTYDPLSTGGATAKADMILNLRTWDTASEVFKKRTQDVLQSLFFLIERTDEKDVPGIDWAGGGMAQFVSALDLNNFKKMIELMAKDMQAGKLNTGDIRRYNTLIDLYRELSSKSKTDLKAQIIELLSIARTLIISNYGDWLTRGASEHHIDLMDIATSDKAPIVLFSFNQQEEPEFAKYIGSIVMSDLSRVSALKNAKGDTTRFGVYIDEFQTLDPNTVKDNLEKARSSRMYITLSLQSIDQIVSSSPHQGEAIANAIIDTCANFIFHDGSGYDTATKMSKIIGKTRRYVYKTTSKPNKRLIKFRLMSIDKAVISKDVEEDWLIPPSEFQSLESPTNSNNYKATAYLINKSSDDSRFSRSGGALSRKIHVIVEDETSLGVPDSFKKEIFIPHVKELEFEDLQVQAISEIAEEGLDIANDIEDDWVIEDIEETNEALPSLNNSAEKEVNIDINIEMEEQLDNFRKLSQRGKKAKVDNPKNKSDEFTLPKLD